MRPGGRPGLVIGYAAHSPDELNAAVARLAQVL
jgi:DNA-binding transcriptional MocR family regulator